MKKLLGSSDASTVADVSTKIITIFKLTKVKNYDITVSLLGIVMEAEFEKFENIKKCRSTCFALLIEFINVNNKQKIS